MFYIIFNILSLIFNTAYFLCKIIFMAHIIYDVLPKLLEIPQVKLMLINIIHKSVFYYSLLQIKYIKYRKNLDPVIGYAKNKIENVISFYEDLYRKSEETNIKPPLTENYTEIQTYDQGKLTFKHKVSNDILSNETYYNEIVDILEETISQPYDIVVFSIKYDKTNNCLNKLFMNKIPKSIEIKSSKIRFFMMKIIYYKVDEEEGFYMEPVLETTIALYEENKYNYYFVGNLLTANFYTYYLTNHTEADTSLITSRYIVELLDHNVQKMSFHDYYNIEIRENEYHIRRNDEDNYIEINKDHLD